MTTRMILMSAAGAPAGDSNWILAQRFVSGSSTGVRLDHGHLYYNPTNEMLYIPTATTDTNRAGLFSVTKEGVYVANSVTDTTYGDAFGTFGFDGFPNGTLVCNGQGLLIARTFDQSTDNGAYNYSGAGNSRIVKTGSNAYWSNSFQDNYAGKSIYRYLRLYYGTISGTTITPVSAIRVFENLGTSTSANMDPGNIKMAVSKLDNSVYFTCFNDSQNQHLLQKLNTSTTIQWTLRLQQRPTGICLDSSDNLYVLFIGDSTTRKISKYTSSGTHVWTRDITTSSISGSSYYPYSGNDLSISTDQSKLIISVSSGSVIISVNTSDGSFNWARKISYDGTYSTINASVQALNTSFYVVSSPSASTGSGYCGVVMKLNMTLPQIATYSIAGGTIQLENLSGSSSTSSENAIVYSGATNGTVAIQNSFSLSQTWANRSTTYQKVIA